MDLSKLVYKLDLYSYTTYKKETIWNTKDSGKINENICFNFFHQRFTLVQPMGCLVFRAILLCNCFTINIPSDTQVMQLIK